MHEKSKILDERIEYLNKQKQMTLDKIREKSVKEEIVEFIETMEKLSKFLENTNKQKIENKSIDIDTITEYLTDSIDKCDTLLNMALEIANEDEDFYRLILKYTSNIYKLISHIYEYKKNVQSYTDDDFDFFINSLRKAGDTFEKISLNAR
jgi:nitrogen-specific signal transduction histidine kinase